MHTDHDTQFSRRRSQDGIGVRFLQQKLLFAFRRRTGLFFAVLAGTVSVALVATFLREPLYQARAEVVIGGKSDVAEFGLIRSAAMAAKVATALHLEVDPEFAGAHGMTQRLHTVFGRPEPRASERVTMSRVVDILHRNLSIERPANTLALTISYTATDAGTAARIANAYAVAYTGGSPTAIAGNGGDQSDSRIISSAALPASPVSPAPFIILMIGMAIGSAFGLLAAVLCEMRFAGLTSGADVRDRLWVPYLGSVPVLASVLPRAGSATDAVVDYPMSAFAEAFRSLWIAIQGSSGERSQVVAIASTLPGEGKTTIAVGLARTLALRGEQVVLIDCAAGSGFGATFGSAVGKPGLENVLGGSAVLDDALVRDDRSSTVFLPKSGSLEAPADPLDGPAIVALIHDLRGRFSHVLIVTGPLATSAEARNVAAMADALVVVVRWRTTAERVIVAALTQLRSQRVKIAGAVLTQVDIRKQVKYSADEATIYQRQFSKYYS